MIAASEALSTSVTKSLCCFLLTWIRSRSSDARSMICPARRAALTAILSIGCMKIVLLAGGCAPRVRVKSQPRTENGPKRRAKTTCVDGNELKKSGARAFFEPAIAAKYSDLQQWAHANGVFYPS